MKVFKTENEKEIVLVTLSDIAMIDYIYGDIPESIFISVLKKHSLIDDDNKHMFVKFSEVEEVEYFRNIDWIYDYDKYVNMPKSKLEVKHMSISKSLEKIIENRKQDANNEILRQEQIKKQYELVTIENILNIKQNFLKAKYLKPGENPNDFIVVRRDGKVKKYPKRTANSSNQQK